MRKTFNPVWLLLLLAVMVVSSLRAEVVVENGQVKRGKFKFKDGSVISGEVIGPRQDGVAFRYDEGEKKGSYSPKFKWELFSQETLKEFRQDNRVKQFVSVLIELDPEELKAVQEQAPPVRPPSPPLELKPVPNMGREFAGASMVGALTSGSGLILLLAIYAANLLAAFEIARYRNYHFSIVCGTGAVVPILGPAIFLCLRTRSKEVVDDSGPQAGDTSESATHNLADAHSHAEGAAEGGPGDGSEGATGYAEAVPVPASVSIPATLSFRRGEVSINRRFIETKFAPFFRVIIGDAEKDLRVVVKASKGEFVGNRISKVTLTDLTLQITDENGVSIEETFPIADLFELQIRHKDAPAQ